MQEFVERLWPENTDVAEAQWRCEEAPLGINETEHRHYQYGAEFISERLSHRGDLSRHFRNQARAISTSDIQPIVRSEQASSIASFHSSAVSLGIHDEDPGRPDDDVIDVGSTTGNSPIVKHRKRLAPPSVDFRAEESLPMCSSAPGDGRLRFVGQSKNESAEMRMSRTDFLFAPLEQALILPHPRMTSFASIDVTRCIAGKARRASSTPQLAIPCADRSGREIGTAARARRWIPESA
jgi:hypothetical protein